MSDVIQRQHEISNAQMIVDPRTFLKKIWDSLERPWIPFAWSVIASLVIIYWPGFIPFAFAAFMFFWLAVIVKPDVLPIHLPLDADKIDLNDPKPGENNGFYKARGSFFVGTIRKLGLEVWVSFKAVTQHWLIFGTTGAGKTESIVSYIVNYLLVGSGCAFQDAKAAPKAMIQMATFCRMFSRDCSFRVTNYITGLTSTRRDPAERMSNDAAVFARGSAESSTQQLVSLMPASQGDNKVFSERAIGLVSAVMPAMTDLRELGKLQIDPSTIRHHMSFKMFASLCRNNHISKKSRDALQAFLESLAGYDEKKDILQQGDEVTRQFGFAQAYFTRALASLSDTYGHIYLVGQGEIDYQTAVLNGLILMTLLPSMEKSGEELANLGKIVLTATKNGMVVGLGTVFEGSADDIVHNLPTNSDIPYGIANDENAYMLVEGQEMINAQARGLGFGVITGTQDAPGMLENISKTTKQIFANSAFKQTMYLDDKETTDLAVELSGEAHVLVRNSYERDGDFGSVYAGPNAQLEKRYRLSATAIKKQGLGQAYITYQGKLHEVQVFNHGIQEKGPDPLRRYVSHWYPVRMAKVRVPTEEEMAKLLKRHPRPEWEELYLMVRDEAIQMQSEMSIYFSSMSLIRKVATHYVNQPDMQELSMEAFAARKILSDDHEEPTGLMRMVCEHQPLVHTDTTKLFQAVAKNSHSGRVALTRMGDATGLDMFIGSSAVTEADLNGQPPAESTGAGGGAGAQSNTVSEPVSTDEMLSSFFGLDEEPHSDMDSLSAHEELLAAREPVQLQPQRPMTDIALAVASNLDLMPWMASQVEYGHVRNTMVQAELFFNQGDIVNAEAAADSEFDRISKSIEYPKTSLPKTENSRSRVRDALRGFID